MVNTFSFVASHARKYDFDRFLCSIFSPDEKRKGLFAILAFNVEISKTREMVSDGLLGEIRLQWWRDTIELIYSNSKSIHTDFSVVVELNSAIKKFNLSRTLFDQLIDARSRDLFDSSFEDESKLYEYMHGTSATICMLFLEVLCPTTCLVSHDRIEAAKSIGIAWALTGNIRASNVLAKQKRIYIPKTLIKEYCLNEVDFYSRNTTYEIKQVVSYIVNLARNEIMRAKNLLRDKVDRGYLGLLLQAGLAEIYLNKIEVLGFDPFSDKIEVGRVRKQLHIAFMALRGSF
jgi:phytoene synthase